MKNDLGDSIIFSVDYVEILENQYKHNRLGIFRKHFPPGYSMNLTFHSVCIKQMKQGSIYPKEIKIFLPMWFNLL